MPVVAFRETEAYQAMRSHLIPMQPESELQLLSWHLAHIRQLQRGMAWWGGKKQKAKQVGTPPAVGQQALQPGADVHIAAERCNYSKLRCES